MDTTPDDDTTTETDASGTSDARGMSVASDAPDQLVDGRFRLVRELGYGSYGHVYAAQDGDVPVAIKLHPDAMLLDREVQIYNYMWKYKTQGHGEALMVPRILWDGQHKSRRALVMSRLGPSLDKLYDRGTRPWSPPTVCRVAADCLTLLHEVHRLGIVHRDIKPDNFAVGHGADAHRIFIFDFGLSSQYISASGKHVPLRTGLSLIGTMRYASRHALKGVLQSRRDDLESLFYMLLYFATNTLPWRNVTDKTTPDRAARSAAIVRAKEALDDDAAAAVPPYMRGYYDAVRRLAYDETFAYDVWIDHFKSLACAPQQADWQLERREGIVRRTKTLRNRSRRSHGLEQGHVQPL